MGLGTTLLVLVSAMMHAVWNALLKRTRVPEDSVVGMVVLSAVFSVPLALALGTPFPPWRSFAWCVASGLLETVYFVTLARALSRAPLGPVYTMVRGGALVVVWPISLLFLHERMTWSIGAGTLCIVLGLVVTGASETPAKTSENEPPLVARLGWAAVCAIFVGSYQIAYKLALADGGRPGAINSISLSTAAVATLVTLAPARAKRAVGAIRSQPVTAIIVGLLATSGFALFLYAMETAGAGLAVTLRNTSILFAQIISVVMGDRPKRLGIIGAIIVMGGAVLLSV